MRTRLLALFLGLVLLTAACGSDDSDGSSGSDADEGASAATIKTSDGNIAVTLFPDESPETVANFVGLATGTKTWTDPETGDEMTDEPLYDGTTFHRVIAGFMIQGGDPLGTGKGGPGYEFDNESDPSLTFDKPYMLAMANAGPDTNGSQFFITVAPTPHLDGDYTIFGEVEDEASQKVVDEIDATPTDANDKPLEPVKIETIAIGK